MKQAGAGASHAPRISRPRVSLQLGSLPGARRRSLLQRLAVAAVGLSLLATLLPASSVLGAGSLPSPTLASIAVAPTSPAGPTQQFVATGTYSDGSTADLTLSVTWASSDPSVVTIDASGLAQIVGVGSTTISAMLGGVRGSMLFIDPISVSIGNGIQQINGTYINAQRIADNLVFTSIGVQAVGNIDIVDPSDLSTSLFGTPRYSLTLITPTLNFDNSLNMAAAGSLLLTANTLNLNGRITSGGSLIDPARVTGTATQVNVLSNAASIQQGMGLSSTTAPVVVQVSAGQYAGNLTIGKPLTLTGNDGTAALGADPTAPEIFGTQAGGNGITVTANNAMVDGLHLNGAVAGGSLAPSVTGVYASSVSSLTVAHNTFEGFSGPSISTPGSTSVTLNANLTIGATDTIAFNAEGGSAVSSVTGLDGTTITLPGAPSDPGYSFDGWFVAPSGGSALSSPYLLSGSLTLYAQWTANATDTIAFNAEGGSAVSSVTGLDGTTITLPGAPSDPGYSFDGWFSAPTSGTEVGGAGSSYTIPSGGATLYAQWTANSYTVTFDANGGSGSMTPEADNAPTALTANTFARTGYTFSAWNSAANGSGTS